MKDREVTVRDMTDQELESHTGKLIFKLIKAAAEAERRTCQRCGKGEAGPELNALATDFSSDVLRAKASGTRLANAVPDVTVFFGGK